VNNQAATLVCDSDLFAPVRRRAEAANPWLGDLVNCHICFGMWAALAHAAYRQLSGTAPRRGLLPALLDALTIAAAGRLFRRVINPEP
jgi:hypothetical protein